MILNNPRQQDVNIEMGFRHIQQATMRGFCGKIK